MPKNADNAKPKKRIITFMLYCIIGIILSLALTFLFAVFIANEKLSFEHLETASYISIYLGIFISSFLSSKCIGKNILTSILICTTTLLLLYLIGAVLFARFTPGHTPITLIGVLFAGAISGAIIAALFKRKKH